MATVNMIGLKVAKIFSGRYECSWKTVSGTKGGKNEMNSEIK